MSSDLYIIAAGKGSRLGGNIPKALVQITDEPCLTTTLQQIAHKFNNVFVVTNELISEVWEAYFKETKLKYPNLLRNVHNVPISSGLGDGHAVLHGFDEARWSDNAVFANDVVIAWGDVFFPSAGIIDELLAQPMDKSGLIPAVLENNPYVTLLVDESMQCISADFSKYGELHPSGFHDQSVFRFNRNILWKSLTDLHSAFWKNGRYITQGGELSMLYAFHHLYNTNRGARVYETDHPTLSFNNVAEVAAIQLEISSKWKSNRS